MSTTVYIALAAVTAIVIAGVVWLKTRGLRPTPPQLEPGSPLPDFEAVHEDGEPVRSSQLRGSPAVILFVRGNWCPFCSAQVKKLTQYYRDITDLGASLILVTPKPLETTRRVAEFFEVDFDFWLDKDLAATQRLGLLQQGGVPQSYDREYGRDTIWPATLVIDAAGIIRYTELSKHISDRPDPKVLLREIRSTLKT
jgi:peroxiredoxin